MEFQAQFSSVQFSSQAMHIRLRAFKLREEKAERLVACGFLVFCLFEISGRCVFKFSNAFSSSYQVVVRSAVAGL